MVQPEIKQGILPVADIVTGSMKLEHPVFYLLGSLGDEYSAF